MAKDFNSKNICQIFASLMVKIKQNLKLKKEKMMNIDMVQPMLKNYKKNKKLLKFEE